MSMVRSSGGISRREPCKKCGNPVFLAERLNVDNHLYHRTCFRCARCTNQLSLANYYETEDGQYCCETCPDEETTVISHQQDFLLKRSVSDEEKEQTLQIDKLNKNKASSVSDIRTSSIHAGEDQIVTTAIPFAKARNHFISSQLNIGVDRMAEDYSDGNNDKNSSADEDPPDLPDTEPPDIFANKSLMDIDKTVEIIVEHSVEDNRQDILTPTTIVDLETKLTERTRSSNEKVETELKLGTSFETLAKQSTDDSRNEEIGDKLNKDIVNNIETDSNINSVKCNNSLSDISNTDNNESLATAAITAAEANNVTILDDRINTEFVTKDDEANNTVTIINNEEHDSATMQQQHQHQQQQQPSSLVQLRKQQFESKTNDNATMVTKIDSELPLESTSQSNSIQEDAKNVNISLEVDTSKLTPEHDVEHDHVPVANVRSQNSNSDEQLDTNNITNSSILSDKGIKDVKSISTSDQLNDNTIDKNKLQPEEDYPVELNPFGDDDTDENDTEAACFQKQSEYTPMKSSEQLDSTNPFGSTDDEDDEPVVPLRKHSTPLKKSPGSPGSPASPAVNLNPFGDDDSSNDDERQTIHAAVNVRPVPKPRSIRSDQTKTPEPTPRLHKQDFSRNNTLRGSGSSLDSSFSGRSSQTPTGTYRKKKPAPQPPTVKDIFLSPEHKTSPSHRTSTTPVGKIRKNRPAPAPPIAPVSPIKQQITPTSTPSSVNEEILGNDDEATAAQPQKFTDAIEAQNMILINQLSPTKSTNSSTSELEKEKNSKDEKNRNRQSAIISSASSVKTIASSASSDGDISSMQILPPNKSTYGKWKRKKGPAPPRPLPQRRQINVLSADELRCQLDIIEIQQQGLEKQGVKLEQLIRDKCEGPGVEEDSVISPEVEDLVLQLFELVNEKNELFRKQAELMYLRRQQRLEEEHADLEYQIRCLMERPERNKTDYDKAREEELINRLIEVVERRNEIVECLEMDRIREAEEDESINMHLNLLAAKRDEDKHSVASSQDSQVKLSKKEKKKQKKIKKTGKGVTIDVDKDVDETEISGKEKKKKKWLF